MRWFCFVISIRTPTYKPDFRFINEDHERDAHLQKPVAEELKHLLFLRKGESRFFHRLIQRQPADFMFGILSDDFCVRIRSEEHTSELQSRGHLVCRLLL